MLIDGGYVAAGAATGFMVGLTGVGGGALTSVGVGTLGTVMLGVVLLATGLKTVL